MHWRVLIDPVVAELDADASHQHVQLLPLLPLLQEGDGEEIPPQIKVGTNPQEPLTQGDEHCNMLDPMGSEVL